MAPMEGHAPLFKEIEKIYLSKIIPVIELVIEDDKSEYKDFLSQLQARPMPDVTEDSLFRWAKFISDRVHYFHQGGNEDEPQTRVSPSMRTLIQLSGTTLGKRRATRKTERRRAKPKKATWTKADTTLLIIHNVFGMLF